MSTHSANWDETTLSGECDPDYSGVKDAFVKNFTDFGEVGARVTVFKGDEKVVDLWGGYTDENRENLWREDTLINTMSVSKGVVAIAAHLLADRNLLDYEAPVAKYWPEFAQGGKKSITVRQLLSHQASLLFIDEAIPGDALDFHLFAEKIARQPPNWTPGTKQSYHSITFGFLVGSLIEKIDGRFVSQFIREELTDPLGADYILGAGDTDIARVAQTIQNPLNELMNGGLINETTLKCFSSLPQDPQFFASPAHWRSVNPSSSGVTHAEAIARIFAPLANRGQFRGRSYFRPNTVEAMAEIQWHANDSLFGNEFSVTMGLLSNIEFNYFGRDGNFGSAGAGGFLGFADPENHLSFGYTPVRQTTGAGLGDEPRRLIDAVYASLM